MDQFTGIRKQAWQALEQMDLLSRRMEIFVSEPTRPVDVALRELEQSDGVVLIIGFIAGSLIPDQPGLTYTRAEFDRACELRKPIFAFIKTERGRWVNKEDDPQLRQALDQFVQSLRNWSCTPAYFENAAGLRAEIALAIGNWEQMGRPGARLTFASVDEYFLPREGLFDYEQTLRGRANELADLNKFLADDELAVAVLLGRGGIGKSKLLRDWSRSITGWQCLFLRDSASWHLETPKEIPSGRVLIIGDDAHRFTDLPKLLILARDPFETRGCKLLLCGRPSGQEGFDTGLTRVFDVPRIVRLPTLHSLQFQDSKALAEEMLGPAYSHLAHHLASVSADTPLVTVIGGRLIARDQISPLLLNNAEDFRRAVFDRYLVEYQNLLPTGQVVWKDLLFLIAALSPLSVADGRFLKVATTFLGLRNDQIQQAVSTLEKHGLLLRRGGLVRIVPDVLSDYLLEQACLAHADQPTGFADEVFTRFGATHLANALRNFAELDWRITQKGASSTLLDQVWSRFYEGYEQADATERCTMLTYLQETAFFQPKRALEIVRYSLQNPAETTDDVGLFRTGQTDILHKLPPILRNVAYHSAHIDEAVKLLWNLAREDSRDTNPHPDHALRVLQKVAGYDRYKSVTYCDRLQTSWLRF